MGSERAQFTKLVVNGVHCGCYPTAFKNHVLTVNALWICTCLVKLLLLN